MARTLTLALLVTGALAALAVDCQAQWGSGGVWSCFARDFRRNNRWPEPFVHPDRESVCLPFEQMTNNGWRKQNLISEFHFDEDSSKLTRAGELKVRWILTQVPVRYRTIFVQRANSNELTTARVDAVQQAAVRMIPNGELPEVVESNLSSEGMPAEDIDRTMREFGKTAVAPRLPAAQGATSAGSGSGN